MKFSCTVQIDRPIAQVVETFTDVDNLDKWQEGFQSIELLSGEKGQVGSRSKIIIINKGQKIELTETIQVNKLPTEFKGLYEAKQMVNTMSSKFKSPDENITVYEADIEYLSFHGLIPKIMAFLVPGLFKKQVQKWMDNLKQYVESRVQ